jgi:hypothetical protein
MSVLLLAEHDTADHAPPTGTTGDESPTKSDTGTPAAADEVEVTLGAYGDGPLEVRAGVVQPAGQYVITDGGPYDGKYKAGQRFQEWHGKYGAEHHMRSCGIDSGGAFDSPSGCRNT